MNILDLPIKPGIIEYYYMYSIDCLLVKTIEEFNDYLSPEIKAIEDLDDRVEAFYKFLE